jgi:hypothetical protein
MNAISVWHKIYRTANKASNEDRKKGEIEIERQRQMDRPAVRPKRFVDSKEFLESGLISLLGETDIR